MKYTSFFAFICLFLSSAHAQRDLHRPIWNELDGTWKANNPYANTFVEWQPEEEDKIKFRQYEVVQGDTLALMDGVCVFESSGPRLYLKHEGQTHIFRVEQEYNHSLRWQNMDQMASLKTLEWTTHGLSLLTFAQNGMKTDYRYCKETGRPKLTMSLQGGFYTQKPTVNNSVLHPIRWGAAQGQEYSFALGLLGRQFPVGAALELTAYQYSMDYSGVDLAQNPRVGRYAFSGLRLAFVPQVYFGKNKWLGLQAGAFADLLGDKKFSQFNNHGEYEPYKTESGSSNRKGCFIGLSVAAPWKHAIKPYFYGRAFIKGGYSFGVGMRF